MSQIFLGILSGTSMDAIDVAAVDFTHSPFTLLGTHSDPYPPNIRQALQELCQSGYDEIHRLGQLDRRLGYLFANACHQLLQKLHLSKQEVAAIGSHGQNIRHQPNVQDAYTMQIGDPNTIAELTGITTIADFRRRDVACAGQGAPLTPAFHSFAFHSPQRNRVVINIGGIANITFLDKDGPIVGFDSGPGNTLLDKWIYQHQGVGFDEDGNWAKQGKPHNEVLQLLLQDDYFQLPTPKSTGTEYFNLNWLEDKINGWQFDPQDIQSTLAEFTAQSIINAITDHGWRSADVLLCGGGIHNTDLIIRIQQKLTLDFPLYTTSDFGVDPNWVEAIAFAWLARQTLNRQAGNLPQVTGAKHARILGGIFLGED